MVKSRKIVVAGDVTIDWFMYPVEACDEGDNWQLYAAAHAEALEGGALLLSRFIATTDESEGNALEVVSPTLEDDIRAIPPDKVIHSNAMLGRFPEKKGAVLRVAESLGYIGPKTGRPNGLPPSPNPQEADVIVLDDAGNGFRENPDTWPAALDSGDDPIIVYKMCRPLTSGSLWRKLIERPRKNLIVVINAQDLRGTKGVHISRSLSWERTARDFLYQMVQSSELERLRQVPYLVVLFDTDGAIVRRAEPSIPTRLVFDPKFLEGGFASRFKGCMHGLTSVFTATLAGELAAHGLPRLDDSIELGLTRVRTLLEAGFSIEDTAVRYPFDKVFAAADGRTAYATAFVEPSAKPREPDWGFWRILDHATHNTRQLVAEEIVVNGKSDGLSAVPVGKFGILETIDRAEIESYAAIRELIVEFLANPKPARPLCFAVFGPPGAGKSFGVKQVLKSIGADNLVSTTFNISQFSDYHDLIASLHQVRDIALSGKVPFVFFDEFDSARGDQALGWLKYFLAPMQDGEFKDGEAIHPVGKAIFVFAGGTRSTYEAFVSNLPDDEVTVGDNDEENPPLTPTDSATKQREADALKAFGGAKGPDFVSRLRGFINIMGPNRQGVNDEAFIIRRAKVLRVMFKINPKAAGLFDSQDRLRIDDGILRAMLYVSKYRHGTRSLEALIDMSRVAGISRYDLSALPPKSQLDLHVDAEEFLFLTRQDRFQSMLTLKDLPGPIKVIFKEEGPEQCPEHRCYEDYLIDVLGRRLYENRLWRLRSDVRALNDGIQTFDELPEPDRYTLMGIAADIPKKLRAINHGLRKFERKDPPQETDGPRTPDISDEDVEQLCRLEHERYCRERLHLGYRYGITLDHGMKTTPLLVPYSELPDQIRTDYRYTIWAIPVVLAEIGYEIYRMEEIREIHDPYLFENLARELHADYIRNREAEGHTVETRPAMVPFDDLPEDKKQANIDNAVTIPRKLAHIGYTIRRVRRDAVPRVLDLPGEKIEEMSKWEHARWNWQRMLCGWIYNAKRDDDSLETPYLVPWDLLDDEIREYDREPVRLIPSVLAAAGYEAFEKE